MSNNIYDNCVNKMDSKLIICDPDAILEIRKEYNISTEEKREEAFKIIEEWLLKQDHLTRKTFSRAYIERCLVTCKGSVEATKCQIDRMCTLRTQCPGYFRYTNVHHEDLAKLKVACTFGLIPKLTKECYRVVLIKLKPVEIHYSDAEKLYIFLVMLAEYLKHVDYIKGLYFILDGLDCNMSDFLPKLNLSELQKFLRIITEGVGCRIKGVIFLTRSKFIETFVRIIKPLFKEKLRNRIHIATTKEDMKKCFETDILPKEYGGKEKSIEEMSNELLATLSSVEVQKMLEVMFSARTDESKRKDYIIDNQYMGLSGSFRTISID